SAACHPGRTLRIPLSRPDRRAGTGGVESPGLPIPGAQPSLEPILEMAVAPALLRRPGRPSASRPAVASPAAVRPPPAGGRRLAGRCRGVDPRDRHGAANFLAGPACHVARRGLLGGSARDLLPVL